jgi:hypothetical protein
MSGEIIYDGIVYQWTLFGGVVIVTAPDGRQKGGSPAVGERTLGSEI